MKYITSSLLLILFSCSIAFAYESTDCDSCLMDLDSTLCIEIDSLAAGSSIDSLCMDIDTSLNTKCGVLSELRTETGEDLRKQHSKKTKANKYKMDEVDMLMARAGFFGDLWDGVVEAVSDAWDALTSLVKNNHGYFEPHGTKHSAGPYTVFNQNIDKTQQLNELRKKILAKEDGFFELYQVIYNQAQSTDYTFCTDMSAICLVARTAKNAAFVYLVGIGIDTSNNPIVLSFNDRDNYKQKVKTILTGTSFQMPGKGFVDAAEFVSIFSFITLDPIGFLAGQGLYQANFFAMFNRAFELAMLVSAFDIVKWSGHFEAYSSPAGTIPKLNNIQSDQEVRDMAYGLKYQYVKPFYQSARNCTFLLTNNNYGLICGGALLMAACALNDYGGYIIEFDAWPDRWANAALYNIHNNMWKATWGGPLSKAGNTYGYAEGSHYTRVAFSVLLPAFRTLQNFSPDNNSSDYSDYPPWLFELPNPFTMHVKNPNWDPDYDNLYKWHLDLMQPDGNQPTFDESWHKTFFNGALAIRGPGVDGKTYSITKSADPGLLGILSDNGRYDIIADYMVGIVNNKPQDNPGYSGLASVQLADGNTVLRTTLPDGSKHYLLGMAETGTALNSYNHEQYEPGHFTIAADKDILAMDPPSYGDDSKGKVDQFDHHNIIYHGVTLGSGDYTTSLKPILSYGNYQTFSMNITSLSTAAFYQNYDTRTFKTFSGDDYFYYILEDNTTSDIPADHELRINGNGHAGSSYTQLANYADWNYRCRRADSLGRWALRAETGVSNTGASYGTGVDNMHGCMNADQLEQDGSNAYGKHSPFRVKVTNNIAVSFLTKLTPYKCGSVSNTTTNYVNNADYTYLHALIQNADTLHNLHTMKRPGYVGTYTLTAPLAYGTGTETFITDGQSAFLSYAENSKLANGGCLSFSNFRRASIDAGKILTYNDTDYIKSTTNTLTAYYLITSKFRYGGFITVSASTSVTFCMPDVEQGYAMVSKKDGKDNLPSVHNSSLDWKWITVTFPKGTTYFTLEPADPCAVDCFFPPTAVKIDSLFNFATGTMEVLGHDLQDTTGSGWLRITNGSKMSICPQFVFHNKDSITLGDCIDYPTDGNPADPDPVGGEGGGGTPPPGTTPMDNLGNKRMQNEQRNMIIVNNTAALVLDSGSRTHVGSWSTLLIRSGGTLLVKKGAMLEVGDKCPYDRGEVICEAGSYVCVEEGADMHFFADIDSSNYLTKLDTFDRHIFYVKLPTHANGTSSISGVNSLAGRGKFLPDSVFGDTGCVTFCDWKIKNGPYGVNNREFGWCNVSFPRARFYAPDTVCIGDSVSIRSRRTLNETGYRITAYRYDTTTHLTTGGAISTISKDTFWLDTNYVFTPGASGYYQLKLWVHNDCGEQDSTTRIVYVPAPPLVSFTLPDSACNGYGTVVANGSASNSNINRTQYQWSVYMIIPDSVKQAGGYDTLSYSASWDFDSTAVASSFNFPGFRFISGLKYAVSLSIKGWCGDAIKWDTVNIPLRVMLTGSSHNVYSPNVGNTSVQLTGKIFGSYTSFTWTPTTGLSSSTILNPVATITADSVRYILKAFTSYGCTDADTFVVRFRKYARVGADTAVCGYTGGNVRVMMGSKMEAALMFGLACYKNPGYKDTLSHLIASYGSLANLSHFMFANNYGTYNSLIRGCSPAFDAFMRNIKDSIYKHPIYVNVYDAFQTNNVSGFVLQFASMVNGTPYLASQCNSVLGSFSTFSTCLNNYVSAFRSSGGAPKLAVTWKKNDTLITSWANWVTRSVLITNPATYWYQLKDIIPSVSEIDSMRVSVDSLPVLPSFIRAYQTDSTVSFANLTVSKSSKTSWLWQFGDGTTSNYQNPIHQFRHFNHSYLVCLTLINACGTKMWCDSILVDSSTIGGGPYGKKGDQENTGENESPLNTNDQTNVNFLSVNVPNPFSNETIVEYALAEGYQNAEIRITAPLGQHVQTYKLDRDKGTIVVDGSKLSDGMYYYSLVIDGTVFKTKVMVVQK